MAKILIVEDELDIAEMYKLKLENEGFKAKIANNGEAGLELSESWQPDLILLDLMMPVMGGLDLLKKLRSTKWGKAIPVIIISNLGVERSDVDLEKYKVSAYIIKALYTPRQLVEDIRKALKK